MKSFEAAYIERLPISQRLLRTVRELGEFKGRQGLFQEQSPQVLETLRHVAVIQSTESSNRIEGIVASPERMHELLARRVRPRDRSEQEIVGYRDALSAIHAGFARMPVEPRTVLDIHSRMFRLLPGEGGHWKKKDNRIVADLPEGVRVVQFVPSPARQTAAAMVALHRMFTEQWEAEAAEPLVLIAAYVLDFLCIHPFRDGNGRMARLLTNLLLYKAGYEVGRYVSLEKVVEDTKASYYDTLYRSSQRWHSGKHDLDPWLEYFLGVMLSGAYQEFERRIGLVSSGRGSKSALVLDVIAHMPGDFSVRDVRERAPGVSIDMVRRVMKQERAAGRLKCLGRGPDTRWRRV
jgi:Fic family protein